MQGDYLGSLAEKWGVDVADLLANNTGERMQAAWPCSILHACLVHAVLQHLRTCHVVQTQLLISRPCSLASFSASATQVSACWRNG